MGKPTLHLMVGLPCFGKTTFAKQLKISANAFLFTPDVWQHCLFGDDYAQRDLHDWRHSTIEAIMWDAARELLQMGVSVILDYGFWAKSERDDFRAQAKQLGVHFQIHYMHADMEILAQRLAHRNTTQEHKFAITMEDIATWAQLFQPPDEDELRGD